MTTINYEILNKGDFETDRKSNWLLHSVDELFKNRKTKFLFNSSNKETVIELEFEKTI